MADADFSRFVSKSICFSGRDAQLPLAGRIELGWLSH
jgi:hypothetical protein